MFTSILSRTYQWSGSVNRINRVLLFLLTFHLLTASLAAQSDKDLQLLKLNKPIERELAAGQSHSYRIVLTVSQYLRVVIEQRGIDVALSFRSLDGKLLQEIDGPYFRYGPEILETVANESGTYLLEIRAVNKIAPVGQYLVSVKELRASTDEDRAHVATRIEASHLNRQAQTLYTEGNYKEAIDLAARAVTLLEKLVGKDHLDVADPVNTLGSSYSALGDYGSAEPLIKRAIAIYEKTLGADAPVVGLALNNLAAVYNGKGDYSLAVSALSRAISIVEKQFGSEDRNLLTPLDGLGSIYVNQGDYENAKKVFERALIIREKTLGSEHSEVAVSLSVIANVYERQGDYLGAEMCLQLALKIYEKTLGPNHPDVAYVIAGLAIVKDSKGDYAEAESLYRRALAIREKVLGREHPDVAESLNNIATVCARRVDYGCAESLLLRALGIYEKTYGVDDPHVATVLNNLGELSKRRSNYDQAEAFQQRALKIRETALGQEHPDVAMSLNNLAILQHRKGNYVEAEALQTKALLILETALGPQHPNVANSLQNLSIYYAAKGEIDKSLSSQERCNEIAERNLSLIISTGSESQKLSYLAALASGTDDTISLHLRMAADKPKAAQLALLALLQRKGRVLDVMASDMALLRRHVDAEGRRLFIQLLDSRSRLAQLVFEPPAQNDSLAHRTKIANQETEVQRLEEQLGNRSQFFRLQTPIVDVSHVKEALPPESALVEIAVYKPGNVKARSELERYSPLHYAAYILSNKGEISWVDLGEAATIDVYVAQFRSALRDPQRNDVKTSARALDEQVMRPIRRFLGGARHVFVSPDGMLNLIPFAALVDEQGRYLIEKYSITHLTSGRDLLRLNVNAQSKQPAIIIANPRFDNTFVSRRRKIANTRIDLTSRRSIDLGNVKFKPLPGTEIEASNLASLVPNSRVLVQAGATETALKRIASPRILHIATHGFFLPKKGQTVTDNDAPGLGNENPLLRSGLVLAGANSRSDGRENDGILTALEVLGLDLLGTELVVLSACETGVGDVRNGDGVYGLRRALVIAGAESQVISLWKVDDEAAKDLMVEYYRKLKQGAGRTEALRQVQLSMLKSTDQPKRKSSRGAEIIFVEAKTGKGSSRSHPYYWASFIQSGDWRSLGRFKKR